MPYIERNQDGNISGLYEQPQDGYATEFLPEDDAAVVAFRQAFAAAFEPTVITYKSDLIDRCRDDAEAATIRAGIAAMGAKLDSFFQAVTTIRHDHPLFPQLKAGFVDAFGQERADELLAPS